MTRQNFLKSLVSAAAAAAMPDAFAKIVRLNHDPDLTVLLADCHINGTPDTPEQYQSGELAKTVGEILKLNPLPSRAIIFGDLARHVGGVRDYMLAKRVLRPLVDAGIQLYIGMGNHDTVKPFLDVYPEYEKFVRVPGEIVFTVDAGAVDFIMLDVLAGNRKKDKSCISTEQQDWIAHALPKWRKPVFVCSHYGAGGVHVHGKRLHELLLASPMTAGYIHGHDHRWRRDVMWQGWVSPRVVKTLCLPSTGHWGDIGWALMRTRGNKARVELRQRDFWFPIKDSPEPGADREMWKLNTVENRGATCSFTLPDGRTVL